MSCGDDMQKLITFFKLCYKYYKAPSDTKVDLDDIFTFVEVLDKDVQQKHVERFRRLPIAQRVFTGESFESVLMKSEFEPGTMGHDFQAFMKEANTDLFKVSQNSMTFKNKADENYHRHAMLEHDFIHFIFDYETTPMGEVMVLSNSMAKAWRWSYFAILFSSLFMAIRNSFSPKKRLRYGSLWFRIKYLPVVTYVRLVREGYKVGKQSPWMFGVDIEKLYHIPTEEVRNILNIQPSKLWKAVQPHWAKLHARYKEINADAIN